jgi:SM-20-related protein
MVIDDKAVAGCAIIEGFLGAEAATDLLSQIIAAEGGFAASKVRGPNQQIRSSLHLPGRVGVDLKGFTSAITDCANDLAAVVGMKAFEIYDAERSIVAHRDGDYYGTHIDTRTQADSAQPSIRVISCVYYLYRTPRKFSGGELRIHRFGAAPEDGSSSVIEPVHDRLVVFPSFLPHEVLPVTLSSDRFEDSRFSINCWLHRAR